MTVQCANPTCKIAYTLDVSKLLPGSWQNMHCKCGQDTKFQVPTVQATKQPVASSEPEQPVTQSAPAKKPVRRANSTLILERESAPTGTTEQIGWLVVHDENTPAQTLTLAEGRNVVGRKSPDKPCSIMIDTTDRRMSRNHSVIEVTKRPDGHYQYLISDCGSTNGTFINANENHRLSPYDQVYLNDGDTIQLGLTKVVLKTGRTVSSPTQAHREVSKKDHLKTIVL